ncbi:cysteine-rich receptor-like protein kinase 42 isoform X1 [Neltuma alba]|nr:cysteine-rich receptor-like protein kinase 42 isoform X1 [Prosopis alba]
MLASTAQEVLTNLNIVIPRIPNFFAATKTPVPNSHGLYIYAFAQCVETVSQSGCQDCLYHALINFHTCLPNSNARAYEAGCFMRYSTNAFFADNQTIDINHFLKQGSRDKGAIIGEVFGGAAFAFILLALFAWIRLPKTTKASIGDIIEATNLNGLVTYNYNELEYATNNFREQNKLGEGGFGAVYKGNLKNGKVVAIKKLNLCSSKRIQEDFESEVKLISNVHHRNLIRLLGWCIKDYDRILVYEYMENNSLDKFIFGKRKGFLNWKQRYDIILGMARGLAYLHEELHIRIVHRDIKPNNILLDDDLQPKIADFGLARLLHEEKYHLSANFAGTLGYAAPEYAIHGQLSEKVDVYSYGVVVLEIISGQKSKELKVNDDVEGEFLLQKAWKLYASGTPLELVDNTLESNDYDAEEVKKIIEIGLLCTQESATLRPTMSEVIGLLQYRGLLERPLIPILF